MMTTEYEHATIESWNVMTDYSGEIHRCQMEFHPRMKALACAECLKHVTIVGPRQIMLRAAETNLARYDSYIATRFSRLLKEDSDGKYPAYPLG